MIADRSRARALAAYDAIKAWGARSAAGELLEGLPVAIRAQGLIVTLASLHAQREKVGSAAVARAIEEWLVAQGFVERSGTPIYVTCMQLPFAEYRHAQAEALAFAAALKLMSKATHAP